MRLHTAIFLTRITAWISILWFGGAAAVDTFASSTPAAGFQAGFASADITPPPGWRRAGGYSEFISQPGGDPLLAKAVVLSQGKTALAWLGNDLTSVPCELTDRARQRISERTGIPVEHVLITATHTHGGPEYYGPLRDFLHARAQRENPGHDPHEVMVELGLAIKSASPFRTTMVVSLANDLDFYIPTRRAFEEGHYEPTTCPLEPGCGEQLVLAAVRLLEQLKMIQRP